MNRIKPLLQSITAVTLSLLMITGMIQVTDMTANTVNAASVSNPRVVRDGYMNNSFQKTTWDCVWFGSYPQTEIVANASDCGTTGKTWAKSSDYEANSSLYSQLASATGWNSNGDITLKGTKYRRIQKSDATHTATANELFYEWGNSSATYRYFRYEPIKWRVLNVNGNQALLLADVVLDNQSYHTSNKDTTWENSTIRSWLNGSGSKNFMASAFTTSEQKAVLSTKLDNSTSDKVFYLSSDDTYNTDISASYGFYKNDSETYDEAKRSESSTYAKAMGILTYSGSTYLGNCCWWLRSPGSKAIRIAYVTNTGSVDMNGTYVIDDSMGVRPALTLDLTSSSWSSAGTVCSNEMVKDYKCDVDGHIWNEDQITKAPTNVDKGERIDKCYVCHETKTEEIPALTKVPLYRYVNKTYTLTSNSKASWKIKSGSKYASLKKAKLTIKKSGTVKVYDKYSKTTVTITIKTPTIAMNKTSVSLYRGQTFQLEGTATPEANVTYSVVSKKYKKYATVTSDGLVTASSKYSGTCYIYAKANGVKKKIKVKVKTPTISMNKTSVSIYRGQTFQLTGTATPDATVTYELVSSKYGKYATVTETGLITASSTTSGTCYIYAKANGVKKKIKVTVK